MRIAERKHQSVALRFGAITDSHYVEVPLETLGYTVNGVRQQAPHQSVQRGVFVTVTQGHEVTILLFKTDARRQGHPKAALRPFDDGRRRLDFDARARRDLDRFLANP